MFRLLGTPE